ncbi:hypothetical protein DFH27DRAFT_556438 [Peziza echinospora]|nr:hypothetical protein DFH27DRAFT_556438 [Peziza echinospora]
MDTTKSSSTLSPSAAAFVPAIMTAPAPVPVAVVPGPSAAPKKQRWTRRNSKAKPVAPKVGDTTGTKAGKSKGAEKKAKDAEKVSPAPGATTAAAAGGSQDVEKEQGDIDITPTGAATTTTTTTKYSDFIKLQKQKCAEKKLKMVAAESNPVEKEVLQPAPAHVVPEIPKESETKTRVEVEVAVHGDQCDDPGDSTKVPAAGTNTKLNNNQVKSPKQKWKGKEKGRKKTVVAVQKLNVPAEIQPAPIAIAIATEAISDEVEALGKECDGLIGDTDNYNVPIPDTAAEYPQDSFSEALQQEIYNSQLQLALLAQRHESISQRIQMANEVHDLYERGYSGEGGLCVSPPSTDPPQSPRLDGSTLGSPNFGWTAPPEPQPHFEYSNTQNYYPPCSSPNTNMMSSIQTQTLYSPNGTYSYQYNNTGYDPSIYTGLNYYNNNYYQSPPITYTDPYQTYNTTSYYYPDLAFYNQQIMQTSESPAEIMNILLAQVQSQRKADNANKQATGLGLMNLDCSLIPSTGGSSEDDQSEDTPIEQCSTTGDDFMDRLFWQDKVEKEEGQAQGSTTETTSETQIARYLQTPSESSGAAHPGENEPEDELKQLLLRQARILEALELDGSHKEIPASLSVAQLPKYFFRVYDAYSVSIYQQSFGFLSGICTRTRGMTDQMGCYTFPSFSNFRHLLLKHANWGNRDTQTPFISVTDSVQQAAQDIRKRRQHRKCAWIPRDPVFAVISTGKLIECGVQVWKMDELIEHCQLVTAVPGVMKWYEREWLCKDQIPARAVIAWNVNIESLGIV